MGEVIVYQWKENNNEQSLSDLILKIQDDSKKLKKTLEVFIPSKISGTSLSGILDILDFLNYSKIDSFMSRDKSDISRILDAVYAMRNNSKNKLGENQILSLLRDSDWQRFLQVEGDRSDILRSRALTPNEKPEINRLLTSGYRPIRSDDGKVFLLNDESLIILPVDRSLGIGSLKNINNDLIYGVRITFYEKPLEPISDSVNDYLNCVNRLRKKIMNIPEVPYFKVN